MPKRKASPTPLRQQPRRAAKKIALSSPLPLQTGNSKAKSKSVRLGQVKKAGVNTSKVEEVQTPSHFFAETAELPGLFCPPFASPTKEYLRPAVGGSEKKISVVVVDSSLECKKESVDRESQQPDLNRLNYYMKVPPTDSEDGSELSSCDETVLSDTDSEFDTIIQEIKEELENELIPAVSIDTHSRVFDETGTLVHESHSLPSTPRSVINTSSKQINDIKSTTITRNITYPLGAKLHYHHSASGTLFPSLTQSTRNPYVTDEEYVLAVIVKAKNESERTIPWDFEVPYGYDGFVRLSGGSEREELVETVNWIPSMRAQGARESLRKRHENLVAAKPSMESLEEAAEETPQVVEKKKGKEKADMRIRTPPATTDSGREAEQFIKISPPGQGALFYQKLAEHRGTLPLTLLPGESRRNRRLNTLYASNQLEGILPLTEDVPSFYSGLTQWNWSGPKVFEVVAWTENGKMQKSMGEKRSYVAGALAKENKLLSAFGMKGVSGTQAEVADWVLRKLELDGGVPDVRNVPYGFAGYVIDKLSGGEESFRVDWAGEAWKWERKVEEHGEGEGYWEDVLEGGGDGESWWRQELLGLEELEWAKEEGYVPWRSQVEEDAEWEGLVRVVDWENAVGEKAGVRFEHLSQPVVEGDLTSDDASATVSKKRKRGDFR